MAELPSGTVTFLFSDIERSTQSAAALGDERYADLQAQHRELLRKVFAANNGHEVHTEGDLFFVAFSRALDAVNAAVAVQRALADHDWLDGHAVRVRIGIHTGEALLRDNDYVGHEVHRAKRIADVGHGGQIVVSHTTRDLVAPHLPTGTRAVALGQYRLKDLAAPEELFQVQADGLQLSFPALRATTARANTLPTYLTSFVGRSDELASVTEMLQDHRLTTLVGVGGCGKTRLAVEAATHGAASFADGATFCDLSRVSDDDGVPRALLDALSAEAPELEAGVGDPVAVLRRFLAGRRMLIVLDNCEHVIAAVADITETLLTNCPDLAVLATSREALQVEGEHAWSVPSLGAATDAVALFQARASDVPGSLLSSDDHGEAVEAICARLDGIPLAIELAAAQVGHLTPSQIAERLDDRFMQVTGGRRRVQRQHTMQAAMDWSWELLSETDRVLLRRFAVFQGGADLAAVEAVCGDGIDVAAGVRSLVAKSLMVVEDERAAGFVRVAAPPQPRYRLLETVRMYAEERLAASGEADQTRGAHRDHYIAWLEDYADPYVLWIGSPKFTGLLVELENIKGALRWSDRQGRNDLVARLVSATPMLGLFFHTTTVLTNLAAQVLDDPSVSEDAKGRVLAVSANHAMAAIADESALTMARQALEKLDAAPSRWRFIALNSCAQRAAIDARMSGSAADGDAAIAVAEEAVKTAASLGVMWEVSARAWMGSDLMTLLRVPEAAAAYATSLRMILDRPTEQRMNLLALEGVGVARYVMGAEAASGYERLWQRGCERAAVFGDDSVVSSMAIRPAEAGDFDEANRILSVRLDLTRHTAPPLQTRTLLPFAAAVAAYAQRWERSARLLGAAMAGGIIMNANAYAVYEHLRPQVRAHLDGARARELRDEGRAMTLDAALDYSLDWTAD